MTKTILEVIEMTAAHSVFIGTEYESMDDLQPVAFFARVKYFDDAYPSLEASSAIAHLALTVKTKPTAALGSECRSWDIPVFRDLLVQVQQRRRFFIRTRYIEFAQQSTAALT